MAQTNINIRIDANRKKEFEEFCEAVGLTMTAAFNIFIQRTLRAVSYTHLTLPTNSRV